MTEQLKSAFELAAFLVCAGGVGGMLAAAAEFIAKAEAASRRPRMAVGRAPSRAPK
jgi:hypothetical protein